MSIHVECTEHGPTLRELEGDEGDDVECSVVDSAERYGNRCSHTLWVSLDVSEVECLLAYLGNLTLYSELHVVDRIRYYLSASHTSSHLQIIRQLDAGHLGVDDWQNLYGDQATSLKVGVVVTGSAVLEGKYCGALGTLLHTALLDHLAQLGALLLALLNLAQLLTAGHSLDAG